MTGEDKINICIWQLQKGKTASTSTLYNRQPGASKRTTPDISAGTELGLSIYILGCVTGFCTELPAVVSKAVGSVTYKEPANYGSSMLRDNFQHEPRACLGLTLLF